MTEIFLFRASEKNKTLLRLFGRTSSALEKLGFKVGTIFTLNYTVTDKKTTDSQRENVQNKTLKTEACRLRPHLWIFHESRSFL